MYNFLIAVSLFLYAGSLFSQSVSQKIEQAFTRFEKDPQLKNAISSLYVINATTGELVFERNSRIGLAPASTQKVITSITAYELLGPDFRYNTRFYISPDPKGSVLVIEPSGDPSFGSWRWDQTRETAIVNRIKEVLKSGKITLSQIKILSGKNWNVEAIPDGWIWQDIGNYYGAGTYPLNWRENQFDLILKSGSRIGDPVLISGTIPTYLTMKFQSELSSAARGTGDNAYIYFQPQNSQLGIVRGTIPVNESSFIISGAMSAPASQFVNLLADSLADFFEKPSSSKDHIESLESLSGFKNIHTETSPPLDSIIYWFNKRSINLYGEALIRILGLVKKENASAESGLTVLKEFWKGKQLDTDELSMIDGSGLSPQNRVTTHAMTQILRFARGRSWFPSFLNSLPEYNGMKMKSGTIKGSKGFTGYHKAANGREYIFSFLVNNYNGSPSSLVNKMYTVLNHLK